MLVQSCSLSDHTRFACPKYLDKWNCIIASWVCLYMMHIYHAIHAFLNDAFKTTALHNSFTSLSVHDAHLPCHSCFSKQRIQGAMVFSFVVVVMILVILNDVSANNFRLSHTLRMVSDHGERALSWSNRTSYSHGTMVIWTLSCMCKVSNVFFWHPWGNCTSLDSRNNRFVLYSFTL